MASGGDRLPGVPSLGADAGNEDREVADGRAHPREFFGVGSAHHQSDLAEGRPAFGDHAGHPQVEGLAVYFEELQVGSTGIGGSTQGDDGPGGEEGLDRVGSEVGVHGDGVGAVATEGLARVLLGGRADIASLRVEDDRDLGVVLGDVAAEPFELVLGAQGDEVGDLWFEGADEVGGRVDDLGAEPEDGVGCSVEAARERRRRIRVEPDAQQRSRCAPRRRRGGRGTPRRPRSLLDQLDGRGGAEIGGVADPVVQLGLRMLAEDVEVAVVTDLEHLWAGLRAPAGGGAQVEIDGDAHAWTLSARPGGAVRWISPKCCRSKADSTARSEAVVMFGSMPIPPAHRRRPTSFHGRRPPRRRSRVRWRARSSRARRSRRAIRRAGR